MLGGLSRDHLRIHTDAKLALVAIALDGRADFEGLQLVQVPIIVLARLLSPAGEIGVPVTQQTVQTVSHQLCILTGQPILQT